MSTKKKIARLKQGLLLTKDNNLIRMKANMTSVSYKLTNYIMLKALKEGRIDNIQITTSEIRNVLNIVTTALSKRLKEEASKIMSATIEIKPKDKESDKWEKMVLIPYMSYENGILTAKINQDLMPYLSGLTSNFTQIDYKQINNCSSYFSMRLAEVCNSWLYKGRAYYSVEEWRGLLGATGKAYDVMSQFRRRVLNPAVEEVNEKMSFTVMPIEHKEGKRTTHIEMIIKRKENFVETVNENGFTESEGQQFLPIPFNIDTGELETLFTPELEISNEDSDLIEQDEQQLSFQLNEESEVCPIPLDIDTNEIETFLKPKSVRRAKKKTTSPNNKSTKLNKKEINKAEQEFATLREEEQDVVRRMVDKYELSLPIAIEAVTQYGISYCQKEMEDMRVAINSGKKIKNKGGYLRKALESGYAESKEAIEKAKNAEKSAREDNALWNKQAHEFFYGKQEKATDIVSSEKSPAELTYEKEYEIWKKKKAEFRKKLFSLVQNKKIEFNDMKKGLDDFEKRFPPPKKPEKEKKEEKEDANSLIEKLLDELN